jgi:hypothetical protein
VTGCNTLSLWSSIPRCRKAPSSSIPDIPGRTQSSNATCAPMPLLIARGMTAVGKRANGEPSNAALALLPGQ